ATADSGGDTALYTAVQRNRLDVAKQLLAAGADPRVKNEWDWTLWHVATTAEMGELLLPLKLNLEALDINGTTPLSNAVFNKQSELALLLIRNGANVNAKDHFGSPLHIAINHGMVDLAAALIQAGADISMLNKEGASPSDLARASGRAELLALFTP
ncbi:MAG: ankyrin repeat domain-containing protein, partial [Pseudomonadota bacterium]